MQFTTAIAAAVLAATASATSGRMTYYDPSVGFGSCGKVYQTTDHIVAMSTSLWTAANPNNDPMCNKSIKITHGGKSVIAKVTDKCYSCGASAIDVSPSVFEAFGTLGTGVIQVDWTYV
jgi:hypothetical protein